MNIGPLIPNHVTQMIIHCLSNRTTLPFQFNLIALSVEASRQFHYFQAMEPSRLNNNNNNNNNNTKIYNVHM